MKNIKDILFYIVIVLGIIVAIISYNRGRTINEYKNNMDALADSIEYYQDNDGKQIAKIQSLETQRVRDIKDIVSRDKEIMHLKNVVSDYKKQLKDKGSVTTFKSNTKIDTVFQTKVIKDTASNFPIYFSEIDLDGWVTGQVKAKVDGVYVDLEIKNQYDIVVGEEGNGLFKKPTPFALVKNYNPYSQVTSLRTYQVALPPRKKFHIGPVVMIDPFSGEVRVGAGITYSIFSF